MADTAGRMLGDGVGFIIMGPSSMEPELYIKTHGSESRGQERAKRIAKNKTRDELLCAFWEAIYSHHLMPGIRKSVYLKYLAHEL